MIAGVNGIQWLYSIRDRMLASAAMPPASRNSRNGRDRVTPPPRGPWHARSRCSRRCRGLRGSSARYRPPTVLPPAAGAAAAGPEARLADRLRVAVAADPHVDEVIRAQLRIDHAQVSADLAGEHVVAVAMTLVLAGHVERHVDDMGIHRAQVGVLDDAGDVHVRVVGVDPEVGRDRPAQLGDHADHRNVVQGAELRRDGLRQVRRRRGTNGSGTVEMTLSKVRCSPPTRTPRTRPSSITMRCTGLDSRTSPPWRWMSACRASSRVDEPPSRYPSFSRIRL